MAKLICGKNGCHQEFGMFANYRYHLFVCESAKQNIDLVRELFPQPTAVIRNVSNEMLLRYTFQQMRNKNLHDHSAIGN